MIAALVWLVGAVSPGDTWFRTMCLGSHRRGILWGQDAT